MQSKIQSFTQKLATATVRKAFRYTGFAFLVVIFLAALHGLFLYKATQIVSNSEHHLIQLYILVTGIFLLSRFLIVLFYSDVHTKRYAASRYPSVSVIIAAKNEEDSIQKTITTCLESEYPADLEVIVINDGSTDGTYAEMCAAEEEARSRGQNVTVISFDENLGKREAMAAGIACAKGELFVFVDSDSFPRKNAIKIIAEHFIADEKIGAVSGNSIVENANVNLVTRMQSARYAVSFDVFKACESVFSTVTCCPGCFSAYRRSAVIPILESWRNQMMLGTRSTFGDDRSLTNFVLRNWKVEYCRHAVASTIVPERFKKFMNQQLRWKKSWIREGSRAATFFWRKHPIASSSFYINLIIPIAGPLVVLYAVVIPLLIHFTIPTPFILGVIALGFLYSFYCYLLSRNNNWWYIIPFIFMYTLILVWQMPYALLTIKDTRWGTR